MSPENSLRGRFSEGKVKGTSDAREARSRCEWGGNLSSLLPRVRIPFAFLSNPCFSGWVEKRTQNKLSPHIASTRGLEPGGRRVLPPLCHDCYLLFSKLTNRKFRSCSFLRVSLSLAISSTFLWRNPNKKKNIFVLAAARLKLFKTTRKKSFCLFADRFFSLQRVYGNGKRGGFINR